MSYFLKSRFVREEMQRLALVMVLLFWAVLASALALRNQSQTLLIEVSESGTKLIGNDNREARQAEVTRFARHFLETYYQFDESTHGEQVSRAGDLMSAELWEAKRAELAEVNQRLQSSAIHQKAVVHSLDLITEGKLEATLRLSITQKLQVSSVSLRVNLHVRERARSPDNPWPFEVTELIDAVM